MTLSFDDAIQVGRPTELVASRRGVTDQAPTVPSSKIPRGLAVRSLHVTRNWDGLWRLLGRRHHIYFLSVTFDLSGNAPVVLPPQDVPADAVHQVRSGEAIQFTLGDGAPVFLPRVISGGLATYITVCEADKGIRHVGEVLAQVHESLDKDGSVTRIIVDFIQNPGKAVADQVLRAATAALQPIAMILKNNRDDYIGLFQGYFSARGPWEGKLTGTRNGTTIELGELR